MKKNSQPPYPKNYLNSAMKRNHARTFIFNFLSTTRYLGSGSFEKSQVSCKSISLESGAGESSPRFENATWNLKGPNGFSQASDHDRAKTWVQDAMGGHLTGCPRTQDSSRDCVKTPSSSSSWLPACPSPPPPPPHHPRPRFPPPSHLWPTSSHREPARPERSF